MKLPAPGTSKYEVYKTRIENNEQVREIVFTGTFLKANSIEQNDAGEKFATTVNDNGIISLWIFLRGSVGFRWFDDH